MFTAERAITMQKASEERKFQAAVRTNETHLEALALSDDIKYYRNNGVVLFTGGDPDRMRLEMEHRGFRVTTTPNHFKVYW